MRLTQPFEPSHMEALLLKIVILDLVLIFLVLSIAFNAVAVYSGVAPFPQVLLLVPAISVVCGIIAFARFYTYISTVTRVSGALSRVYKEFDGGKATMSVDMPQPFLIFRHFVKKNSQPSPAKDISFLLESESAKYRTKANCVVKGSTFVLELKVVDWHGLEHTKSATGNIARVQPMVWPVVRDIRAEVLEARGIQTEKIKSEVEYFIPVAAKPTPGAMQKPLEMSFVEKAPEVEIAKPTVSLRDMVQQLSKPEGAPPVPPAPKALPSAPPAPKAAPPAPPATPAPKIEERALAPPMVIAAPKKSMALDDIMRQLDEIKQLRAEPKAVSEHKGMVQQALAATPSEKKPSPKDTAALQDLLFQLEEIEKVMKEK